MAIERVISNGSMLTQIKTRLEEVSGYQKDTEQILISGRDGFDFHYKTSLETSAIRGQRPRDVSSNLSKISEELESLYECKLTFHQYTDSTMDRFPKH